MEDDSASVLKEEKGMAGDSQSKSSRFESQDLQTACW